MIASLSVVSDIRDDVMGDKLSAFRNRFKEVRDKKGNVAVVFLTASELSRVPSASIYYGTELFLLRPFNVEEKLPMTIQLLTDPRIICHVHTEIQRIPEAMMPMLKNLFPEEFL